MARGLENRRFKCDKQWAKDLWLETKQQIRYPEGKALLQLSLVQHDQLLRAMCADLSFREWWLLRKAPVFGHSGSVKFQHTVNTEGTTYDSRYGQLSNASMPQIWNRLLERNTEDCTQYSAPALARQPAIGHLSCPIVFVLCRGKSWGMCC